MSDVTDHVQLNAGVGGATIATDYVTDSGGTYVHYQIVKVAHGTDGSTPKDVTRTHPLPVTIEQHSSGLYSNPYMAVAGSTDGTEPVAVTGDLSIAVGEVVGISGGTLSSIVNGVSSDIRTIHGNARMRVYTSDNGNTDKVTVSGDVSVTNTADVNITGVDLPTEVYSDHITITAGGTVTLAGHPLNTGVRIKNVGSIPVTVGSYTLDAGENIFVEISNTNKIAIAHSGTTGPDASVCWIAT